LIPGGVTKVVDANLAGKMSGVLSDVKNFIDKTYLPNVVVVAKAFSGDLLAGTAGRGVGRGCKKFLSYGTFPDSANSMLLTGGFLNATAASHTSWTVYALNPANIEEHITYSYYYDDAFNSYTKLHPSVGATKPSYGKAGAYSWLKAPRYQTGSGSANCHVCEVGPLARVLVTYKQNSVPGLNAYVNAFITNSSGLNMNADTAIDALPSVLGRHAARAVETQVIADTMQSWIQSLQTTSATGQTYRHRNIPRTSSTGFGLTEAPRGALGHWMRIDGRKISNYQCVVPTTWNGSPKDDYGQIGPIEHAISGSVVTDDATGRVRVGRIVRSFDPCIACAVHIVSPDKKKVTKFEVVPNR
jgi:Ni,Fe-hydrogenase I large subunit